MSDCGGGLCTAHGSMCDGCADAMEDVQHQLELTNEKLRAGRAGAFPVEVWPSRVPTGGKKA